MMPSQLGSNSDEVLLQNAAIGPLVQCRQALPPSVLELLCLTNDIGEPLPASILLPQSGAASAADSRQAVSPHLTAAAPRAQSWTDPRNLQGMTNDLGDPIPLSIFQRPVAEPDEGLPVESHAAAVRRLTSTATPSKKAAGSLRVPGTQEPTEDGCKIGMRDLLRYRQRLGGAKVEGGGTGLKTVSCTIAPQRVVSELRAKAAVKTEGEGTGLETASCTTAPQRAVSKLRAKAVAKRELGPAGRAPSSLYVEKELPAHLRGIRARVHVDEPCEVARQCSPAADSDAESECSAPSEPDESAEIIVGPTNLAVMPLKLEDLCLFRLERHTGTVKRVPLVSNPRRLSLADALRLSHARPEEAPLSFGSTLHLSYGAGQPCRPCMFERWAGRCIKSWLCDFCHLHTTQKARRDGPRAQARTKAAASRRKRGV
uniref:Uncharacterized protein n=1 Tax=Alexandrium monilatum TaxID=311494 RepID=A0A7S4W575_9DINO